MRFVGPLVFACSLFLAFGQATAQTYTIDFESTPALSVLAGGMNTFAYGSSFVQITGGGVVQNAGYGGDATHILATTNECLGCAADLFLNFSTPVSDVSLDVYTFGSPFSPPSGPYSLFDNDNGHSTFAEIVADGHATLSLPFENMGGGFSVTAPFYISQDPSYLPGAQIWAYAIDNLTFTVASPVPEPKTYALLLAGLLLLAFAARRGTRSPA